VRAPSPPLAQTTPQSSHDSSDTHSVSEVKRQLLVERSNYEKLMVQVNKRACKGGHVTVVFLLLTPFPCLHLCVCLFHLFFIKPSSLFISCLTYIHTYIQMLVLTNDLNEREDQIIALKKREEAYTEQLASKDRMYEQDAMVRMQLGKRLEQVLMDKEEIKDERDNLLVCTPNNDILYIIYAHIHSCSLYYIYAAYFILILYISAHVLFFVFYFSSNRLN
jgi:hypothetical protein